VQAVAPASSAREQAALIQGQGGKCIMDILGNQNGADFADSLPILLCLLKIRLSLADVSSTSHLFRLECRLANAGGP
jgi:hypothetical protein